MSWIKKRKNVTVASRVSRGNVHTFEMADPAAVAEAGRSLLVASADGTAMPTPVYTTDAGAAAVVVADTMMDDMASSYMAEQKSTLEKIQFENTRKKEELRKRLAARKAKKGKKKKKKAKAAASAAAGVDPGDGLGPLPVGWTVVNMPDGRKLFNQPGDGGTTWDDPRTDEVETGEIKKEESSEDSDDEDPQASALKSVIGILGIGESKARTLLEANDWDAEAACSAHFHNEMMAKLEAQEKVHAAAMKKMEDNLAKAEAAHDDGVSPFIMMRAQCPPGVGPGQRFTVNLPDGRATQITVPASCPPGGTVQFKIPRATPGAGGAKMIMLTVRVPQGVQPGQKMNVRYNGKLVQVVVPQGAVPLSTFKVTVNKSALDAAPGNQQQTRTTVRVKVAIPPGLSAGQSFQVRTNGGALVKIVVPAGAKAGQFLTVQLPA